tara:strand:+ start:1869 stop:2108 length:240 start_codon:yes stop_codon:yes gene_type:complete
MIKQDEPTIEDISILENVLVAAVDKGCRECGNLIFTYQAGLSIEKESKLYLFSVDCACGAEYVEILDARYFDDNGNEEE